MINLKMKKKRIVITVAAVAWLACMPITGVTLWFACTAIASALVSLVSWIYGFILISAASALYKGKNELNAFDRMTLRICVILGEDNDGILRKKLRRN